MYEYKNEIISSRVGCIGSSDGKMLWQIANMGFVPKTTQHRLAVVKGLIPPVDGYKSKEMAFGDYVENAVYDILKDKWNDIQSNPRLESKKLSRKNVKLISHPDFFRVDNENKVVYVYECKATKFDVAQTRSNYKTQLYIHQLLAKEYAEELGKGWRAKLFLVIYNTDGIDYDNHQFDVNRLSVHNIRIEPHYFDIAKAMDLVDVFLDTFDEYYGDGDEVDGDLLPDKIKSQFTMIATMLQEIKTREEEIAKFKERLYAFMDEKGIKSVKNNYFQFVRIDPSESKSFDYKRYIEEETQRHPRKMRKVVAQYTKTTKKKGYVTIKVAKPDEQ